jgi:SpoVK/Ycf46/Vps4 family AAA+-type ATPase
MAKSDNSPSYDKFKLNEIKTYASTEFLADNKKKYRQVFDRYDTTYIYAELTFFNKQFDKESWDTEINLKCFKAGTPAKEICNIELQKKVSKYDSKVYIREGWGNKNEGSFWKAGTYFWEAYIGGEKVGTKYFYIEDVGYDLVDGYNPYMTVKSVKLYEGQYDDVPKDRRQYMRKFATDATRYIYVELDLENINLNQNWHCEVFINFKNEVNDLKGRVTRLKHLKIGTESTMITAGWGSNNKGSWKKGDYSVEIVFMDRIIALVQFEVNDEFEEGTPIVELPFQDEIILDDAPDQKVEGFEDLMVKLDRLIGLDNIKQKVREHASYIKFVQLRKDRGFEELDTISVHSVFTGNPGTGKTTVAQMMGQLYKKMGLLTKGHVHEVDRVDLVGEYIGQTAPKVKEAIERAKGGVLFIDEAYSLARSKEDSKDFGREVIEILVKEMSNGTGDMAVIVAGYPDEMEQFLDSNPGLRSRFKHFFQFPDYTPGELMQIADYAAAEREVILAEKALVRVNEMLVDAFRDRDRSFGNARYVHDLIDKAKFNMGLRVMGRKTPEKLPAADLMTILEKDILAIKPDDFKHPVVIPVDRALLDEAMIELDALIGIDRVKQQITELVEIVRYYRESGKNVLASFSLHTVFSGNPGTGKTTVARILTKIYKALGVLERGHIVETDRQGLVAGYVGQTAIKTAKQIDQAMGGVLFIDEAYALARSTSNQGDFGDEAIQTLLKRMEDNRGEFFVFVAGYPKNMNTFLKTNPGLNSRFDKVLHFDDYSSDELTEIAAKMYRDEGMSASKKAIEFLRQYFADLYVGKDQYFGNARTVRKIILASIKHQNLRLAAVPVDKRSSQMISKITHQDVVSAIASDDEQPLYDRKRISFGAKE